MTTHVGLIRSINGIDYNFHSIPNIVTIFPFYIYPEEANHILSLLTQNTNTQTIINCLSNEIIDSIYSTLHLKLQLTQYTINEISLSKGIFPTKHTSSFIAILNIGKSGSITFKNNKTNEKYTFNIDNGMMILIQDSNNNFTHNIQMDTSSSNLNIDNTDQSESRYIITLNYTY